MASFFGTQYIKRLFKQLTLLCGYLCLCYVIVSQFLSIKMSVEMPSWSCLTTDSMIIWTIETAWVCAICTRQLSFMTINSWSNILCSLAFKVKELKIYYYWYFLLVLELCSFSWLLCQNKRFSVCFHHCSTDDSNGLEMVYETLTLKL